MDVLDADRAVRAAVLAHRARHDELRRLLLASGCSARWTRVYAVRAPHRPARHRRAGRRSAVDRRPCGTSTSGTSRRPERSSSEAEATRLAASSELDQRHRAEVAELLGSPARSPSPAATSASCCDACSCSTCDRRPSCPSSPGRPARWRSRDRVVLFNDFAPQRRRAAEVWDRGLGRVRGVVALPHARRRLRLDDRERMRVFVRRFADARACCSTTGTVVALGPDGELPPGARVIGADGTVRRARGAPS